MFFDMDEFLFLNAGPTVRDYLTRREFDAYDMIHVNWLGFGDDGQVHYEDKPVQNRIIHALPVDHKVLYDFPENFHVKSIVRGGLKEVVWDKTSHTPTISGKCCNATGISCDNDSPFTPYDFRMAGLRHFSTKTAEEYADKVLKGFPDGNPITRENLVSIFFKKNEPTKEKIEIFKEKLGVDMSYLLADIYEGEKRKDVQIFSLCYERKKFAFLNDAVVTPLQVGAANGKNVCALKDNTGDNISAKNYFFIENTGTYWIWKNVKGLDCVGIMQYRKLLQLNRRKNVKTNLEITHNEFNLEPDIDALMTGCDVILANPLKYSVTLAEKYKECHIPKDLDLLDLTIKECTPEYHDAFVETMYSTPGILHSYNIFLMKWYWFEKYCSWIFPLFKEMESRLDLNNHTGYQQRVFGYMSERLLNVFCLKNKLLVRTRPAALIKEYYTAEKQKKQDKAIQESLAGKKNIQDSDIEDAVPMGSHIKDTAAAESNAEKKNKDIISEVKTNKKVAPVSRHSKSILYK